MKKMLALLAACLWLAGCSGDGPDGGSGNLNIVFDCSMPLQVVAGETCEVGYTLEGASENARVRVVAPDGYRVQVIETNYWSGKIVIYLPDAATDERIVVILSDEGNETVSRYIDLEVKAKSDVVFDLSANSYLIEAEGTSLRVMLITNIDYTVEIAEKDRTWISVETSRTDQREESLVFSFRPNSDVKSRQATVRLVDSEGNLLDSICFTQATSGSVNVRLERADVWTQVIWLSGSCASDVAQAGFRYRKQGDKEWVEVAGAGSSNGFSAHVEAEPETTYEIMACWRDEESRIHIVTTLPALKLPNG
ncbi:BACON domain-containing protein, partial [Alistipes putredinis]